ncbi:MAG: hypothetical protein WA012_01835 [Rhodoferax sp.]|uniref:hypothetical protein n=1 Tax=Rhodoferax sp. TaxID=50421 RepID=UPI003BB1C991
MNRLVIANAVKQFMTSEGMDRHGLRPRDDGAGSRFACARKSFTYRLLRTRDDGAGSRFACGIGPDSGGSR